MSKITKTTRVFLTIEVEEPWNSSAKPHQWASDGRAKADELKRLLNAANIDGLSNVDWHVESPEVCSLCGIGWEVDEDGCPMCCSKAQLEWEEGKAKEVSA